VTSTNGAQWTLQTDALIGQVEDMTFANNIFLAVGDNGLIASSLDGVSWIPHRILIHRPNLRGVTYADGRFVAVGNNETILQSGFFGPPILRVRSFTADGFEFSIDAELGRNYRLQGSLNLRDWSDLDLFSNTEDETGLFLDSGADQLPQRFYRVVSP